MIIAKEKLKTNIIEYILYMWQIEDLIRAYNFDLQTIKSTIIEKFDVSKETKYEMKLWYRNLIESMMRENKAEKGHIRSVEQYIVAIDNLHRKILTTIQDKTYQKAYLNAKPHINILMIKSGGEAKNEVHACLNGMYGILLLKMKGEKISDETRESANYISKFLAILAQKYNEYRSGKLDLSKSRLN